MTTKQALGELKTLVKSAKENLYRRIALAREVLGDLDWIATVHGGSDLRAQDALQSEFFPDLAGYVSLGKLILMQQHVPVETWQECRYDIAAVEVLYDQQRAADAGEPKPARPSWKTIAEERAARISELERELSRMQGRLEELEKFARLEPAAA